MPGDKDFNINKNNGEEKKGNITEAEKVIRDQIGAYHIVKQDFSREVEEARAKGEDVSNLEAIIQMLDERWERLSKTLNKFE